MTTLEILEMLYDGVPVAWIDALLAGKVPTGVPRRPDRVYPEWTGWDNFLNCHDLN